MNEKQAWKMLEDALETDNDEIAAKVQYSIEKMDLPTWKKSILFDATRSTRRRIWAKSSSK